jgi:hypothetical protein
MSSRILPVNFIWKALDVCVDGGEVRRIKAMVPLDRYHNVCARQYGEDGEYTLVPLEERSMKSHNAYFAQLHSAFQNLPETLAARWPTEEHMRKWVLIETGWFEEKEFPYEGRDARRHAKLLATFIRTQSEFARISTHRVSDTKVLVIVRTAKSQSKVGMPTKAEFEKSKRDVLDWLEHAIGVARGTLVREGGMHA